MSYFNKTVASKDMSGYYLLKNGEFAYNKSYSVGYDFGSIKRLDRYPMGALSTLYICFALKRNDSDFMKVYFDSLKWYREIYMIAAEGARNHGLLNVPTEEFFATRHILPTSISEQKKLASLFMLLEKRIDTQRQLVDSLKSYKRGVASALFEHKIRMKHSDGCMFTEWEKSTLGSVFRERVERASGGEKLLAVTISNGVQERSNLDLKDNSSEDKSNYRKVYTDDIAYNTMRMWQGACGVSAFDGIVSPAYTVIYVADKTKSEPRFWAYLFKEIKMLRLFQRNSQGLTSDTWNLKFDKFSKIAVEVPSLDEQTAIADYLDSISRLIEIQEDALAQMEKYKRSLLSQMFI